MITGERPIDEKLLQQRHGLLRACYGMRLLIRDLLDLFVDLVVIAAGECLVAEEVDLLVMLQELQTIGLVPADRKYVERDLSANGIGQPDIRELVTDGCDELLTDLMRLNR